ncbi:hypothetical protein B0H17DRAFT_1125173 [Mycena rosella]|uniref:Uncharacterized protein n=1 Tax=Mycena rosella TaxID=1033263 RepID=A0AAD7GXF2_MYCRO|nr:hypothetical protein B0H17DRAFT_1125173 [Mycena rosella]
MQCFCASPTPNRRWANSVRRLGSAHLPRSAQLTRVRIRIGISLPFIAGAGAELDSLGRGRDTSRVHGPEKLVRYQEGNCVEGKLGFEWTHSRRGMDAIGDTANAACYSAVGNVHMREAVSFHLPRIVAIETVIELELGKRSTSQRDKITS